MENRKQTEEREENDYITKHTFLPVPRSASGVNQISQTSSNIRFWANYGSWTFCFECNSVLVKILPHNSSNRPKNDNSTKCICSQSQYIVPLYKNIPTSLLSLTVDDITILRPFYLFLEKYEHARHGYQVKCCPIKLKISDKSVHEKIDQLADATQKEHCQNAYEYLMSSDQSAYSHFLRLTRSLHCRKHDNKPF